VNCFLPAVTYLGTSPLWDADSPSCASTCSSGSDCASTASIGGGNFFYFSVGSCNAPYINSFAVQATDSSTFFRVYTKSSADVNRGTPTFHSAHHRSWQGAP
jgi:hypothetical protein